MWCILFFQAEDGIRDLVRSRGLGDVYKRQIVQVGCIFIEIGLAFVRRRIDQTPHQDWFRPFKPAVVKPFGHIDICLLYTSDAADERSSVDLGGRRIIKKKKRREAQEVRSQLEKRDCKTRIDELATRQIDSSKKEE